MAQAIPQIVGLALSLVGTGASIYQGEEARKGQKQALRNQEQAQQQAGAAAQSQQRRADQEFARLNRKAPDIGTLLAGEQATARTGPASTLLTGPFGVDPQRLRLGRSSLLGA